MQDETEKTLQPLAKGDMTITAGGGDYVAVEVGEPHEAHISNVEIGEGNNFNTGEKESRLVVSFKLDKGEGAGQVYKAWFKPSLHEKAKLTKLVSAIFGEVPAGIDPWELVGHPVRITLRTSEKNPDRLVVDTYLKPAKGQVKIEQDTVISPDTDVEKVVEQGDDVLAQAEAAFGSGVEQVS